MKENKEGILEKISALNNEHNIIKAEDKMLTAEGLIKYFKLIFETYKKEYLEYRSELRFQKDDLKDQPKPVLIEKLFLASHHDQHHDLDLIIYPDRREQIRKAPRMLMREKSIEQVKERESTQRRFSQLQIPSIDQELLQPAQFKEYAKETFIPHAENLCKIISTLLPKYICDLLQSKEKLNSKEFLEKYKSLSPSQRKLAELYQLTHDIGEAFDHSEDIKALRSHCYFLYLVFDEMYDLLKNQKIVADKIIDLNGKKITIEEVIKQIDHDAQILLQHYFDIVIGDDMHYMKLAKTMDITDEELKKQLANVLVRDKITGNICKFSESVSLSKALEKFPEVEVSNNKHRLFPIPQTNLVTDNEHLITKKTRRHTI